MNEKLIVHAAINSLSIGNVNLNILRELYNRKVKVMLFVRDLNLSAYNIPLEFKMWLENAVNNRYTRFAKDIPSFSCWHLNGSESKFSNKQYLLSFHETDSPTAAEVNIAKQQEHVFFSSNWTVNNFKNADLDNVSFLPLGFDTDFHVINKKFNTDDVIHWLIGPYKFEKRKNTQQVIELWLKKYGNNRSHKLTIAATNPFLRKESIGFDTKDLINNIFRGVKYSNVNILDYIGTNAEINQLMNSADINLSGITNAEGWNLPAFNSTALGKQTIVTNCTAQKDWATAENSILIEPNGMQPCYDGIFFNPNQPFNQGNYFSFTNEQIVEAFEKAEKVGKIQNTKGLELQTQFTYKNTVDKILETINK